MTGGGNTSMEISSMTSGSFDKSSAEGRPKKTEKPAPGKPIQTAKLREASKGLPMISEKSGTPSEVSANE